VFTKDEAKNSLSAVGLPQLYFDQLRVMKAHIAHTVQAVVHKAITGPKFNRRSLQKQSDWPEWRDSEWIQLDNYDKQGMFGIPCTAPLDASIFFWVWLYSIKPHENNRKKVRGVCDGSTRGGQTMIHGATYAPTPQQIDFRIQIALATTLGMFLFHADVSNAFAEADRPKQMYYMRCDSVFREWWKNRHPDTPLPPDAVTPVLKNLQGHPEGPRLWGIKCHSVLIALDFTPTTHAPCLYQGTFNNEYVLFLRQVDDFAVGCRSESTYIKLCDALDKHWQVPMTRYGMMKHFNGIDVSQSRTHISISTKTYLDTVFTNYGWNLTPTSLPMNPSNEFVRALDDATPLDPVERTRADNTRFRYRAAIGELIWPMITTRPEISYPVVKLSQFSSNPAKVHYDAVYGIFQYLFGTRKDDLTYT
jgi:hypothetical protein